MKAGLYAVLLLGILVVGLALTLLTGSALAGLVVVGPGTVLLVLTRARS
jgi:hypothetical protein